MMIVLCLVVLLLCLVLLADAAGLVVLVYLCSESGERRAATCRVLV